MFFHRLTESDMKPLDNCIITDSGLFPVYVMGRRYLHLTLAENLTFFAAPPIIRNNSGICLMRARYADTNCNYDGISDIPVSFDMIL